MWSTFAAILNPILVAHFYCICSKAGVKIQLTSTLRIINCGLGPPRYAPAIKHIPSMSCKCQIQSSFLMSAGSKVHQQRFMPRQQGDNSRARFGLKKLQFVHSQGRKKILRPPDQTGVLVVYSPKFIMVESSKIPLGWKNHISLVNPLDVNLLSPQQTPGDPRTWWSRSAWLPWRWHFQSREFFLDLRMISDHPVSFNVTVMFVFILGSKPSPMSLNVGGSCQ